jgi:hypothetical protein
VEKLPDIQNQLSHQNLFLAFKSQLAKDFEQSNFSADFAETLEPDYERIVDIISAELKNNEKKSDSSFMPLLYRIDISEMQLKKYLDANKTEPYYTVIAELIIKRVLQKVVIKQFYKHKDNS